MNKGAGGLILVIAIVFVLLVAALGSCNSSSSSRNEPWRDLGVSEREYMQVYNYYKYGEWS